MTCEFCGGNPRWRFFKGDYTRYACSKHTSKVRRLIALDRGVAEMWEMQFELVTGPQPCDWN